MPKRARKEKVEEAEREVARKKAKTEYYDKRVQWPIDTLKRFLHEHKQEWNPLHSPPTDGIDRKALERSWRGPSLELFSAAMLSDYTWIPGGVFMPPPHKADIPVCFGLVGAAWGYKHFARRLSQNMRGEDMGDWERCMTYLSFYTYVSSLTDLLMRNYTDHTLQNIPLLGDDVYPLILRLLNGDLLPHPYRAYDRKASEQVGRRESVVFMKKFLNESNESRTKVTKHNSSFTNRALLEEIAAYGQRPGSTDLFRLYATVAETMIAFGDENWELAHQGLSRLAALYLTEYGDRYVNTVTTTLERLYHEKIALERKEKRDKEKKDEEKKDEEKKATRILETLPDTTVHATTSPDDRPRMSFSPPSDYDPDIDY